jgi:phosphoribosylglycinamide formyltransferase 1
MPENPAIVVLISGSGSNLQAIIDAVQGGRISGHIAAVISNRPDAHGLERASQAGIPTRVLDHSLYPDRDLFDAELMSVIDGFQPQLVVLAGFMRILTESFVRHYAGRMLNIHPSLLPKYRGLKTHARAIEAGDSEHGVSVHFVTPELDGGPVVLQARVPVGPGETPETLAARVLEKEHIIYPLAIGWYLSGQLQLENQQVVFKGKTIDRPLQLDEIEQ